MFKFRVSPYMFQSVFARGASSLFLFEENQLLNIVVKVYYQLCGPCILGLINGIV